MKNIDFIYSYTKGTKTITGYFPIYVPPTPEELGESAREVRDPEATKEYPPVSS